LDKVSRDTRITTEYLEALLERNCSKMKRVQALGFISILEREYNVDLSSLKKECEEYFRHDKKVEKEIYNEITVVSIPDDDEESKIDKWRKNLPPLKLDEIQLKEHLKKIGIGFIIVVMSYASWQVFVPSDIEEYNNTSEIRVSESKKEVVAINSQQYNSSNSNEDKGFFDSVVSVFDSDEKSQNQNSNVENIEKVASSIDIKNKIPEKPKEEKKVVKKVEEKVIKKEKRDEVKKVVVEDNIEDTIIRRVQKEEMRKSKRREEEVPQISDLISSATAGVDDLVDDTKIDEVPLKKTASTSNNTDITIDEEPAPEPPKKKKVEKKKYSVITFHPRSKVWLGYTNLSTMKRKVVTGSDDLKFDVSKDSYIVATGHGRVEFLSKNRQILKLADGKKHFFKVSDKGVVEISHAEFQKLNKSKVW